jgi:hypothetical protein
MEKFAVFYRKGGFVSPCFDMKMGRRMLIRIDMDRKSVDSLDLLPCFVNPSIRKHMAAREKKSQKSRWEIQNVYFDLVFFRTKHCCIP